MEVSNCLENDAHKSTEPEDIQKTLSFQTGVVVDSDHNIRKRETNSRFRFNVEYTPAVDKLSRDKVDLIKNFLLPKAEKFISDRISVKQPLNGPIRLYRECLSDRYFHIMGEPHTYCQEGCSSITRCGDVVIPEDHLQACYACYEESCDKVANTTGRGVQDTDFVLYVHAEETYACQLPDTTAHASFCQLESVLDRPIAGFINLCPSALSMNEAQKSILLTTVKHEMIHALGFSPALYAFYRDANGDPYTERKQTGRPPFNATLGYHQWSDRVVKTIYRNDWEVRSGHVTHPVQMLVTPKVQAEARRHFNCSTLEGIELENNGGIGTELSHFEKRLLENEAMTGTHTHERQFSRMTLAVLEDTGWYKVNYELAHPLQWGRNLGCNFARKSCKSWMDSQRLKGSSLSPFCQTIQSSDFNFTCNVGRTSVATCNAKEFTQPLPQEYQYFDFLPGVPDEDLDRYGGSSALADYCPFFQQFSYRGEDSSKSSVCNIYENSLNPKENVAAEYYGEGSVCINHGSPWKQEQCIRYDQQLTWGAGCYQYHCSEDGLKIVIGGVNHLCLEAGMVISVSVDFLSYRHLGSIICPACYELCNNCQKSNPAITSKREVGDEGECPRFPVDDEVPCEHLCKLDSDCPQDQLCCMASCGLSCHDPVRQYSTDVPCGETRTGFAVSLLISSLVLYIVGIRIVVDGE